MSSTSNKPNNVLAIAVLIMKETSVEELLENQKLRKVTLSL